LLNEVGEILYRMDEIDGNLKKIIPNLIEVIRKQINQNQQEESVFLKKNQCGRLFGNLSCLRRLSKSYSKFTG